MTNVPNPADKVYYLASPYSTPTLAYLPVKLVKWYRHYVAQKIGTDLFNKTYTLIEPIATSHYKATKYHLPGTYTHWMQRDRLLVKASDGIIVAMIPHWQSSVGVSDEIRYAKQLGKPVYYYDPSSKEFVSEDRAYNYYE